jgi:hypothetical protein
MSAAPCSAPSSTAVTLDSSEKANRFSDRAHDILSPFLGKEVAVYGYSEAYWSELINLIKDLDLTVRSYTELSSPSGDYFSITRKDGSKFVSIPYQTSWQYHRGIQKMKTGLVNVIFNNWLKEQIPSETTTQITPIFFSVCSDHLSIEKATVESGETFPFTTGELKIAYKLCEEHPVLSQIAKRTFKFIKATLIDGILDIEDARAPWEVNKASWERYAKKRESKDKPSSHWRGHTDRLISEQLAAKTSGEE